MIYNALSEDKLYLRFFWRFLGIATFSAFIINTSVINVFYDFNIVD